MNVDLSGVKTKLLLKELAQRALNIWHHDSVSIDSYRRIAAQYGVDSSDDSLVMRFFLEIVPSLAQEEQDLIELQLKL